VAAVFAGQPLVFSMGHPSEILGDIPSARFEIFDSGLRSETRTCIAKVLKQKENDPKEFERGEKGMRESADLAIAAYRSKDLNQLAKAMKLAQESFRIWGLSPTPVESKIRQILDQGALAAKITGSGLGGFIVALYPNTKE
jgi:mevalonate kinase